MGGQWDYSECLPEDCYELPNFFKIQERRAPFSLWRIENAFPCPVVHTVFLSGEAVVDEILHPTSLPLWILGCEDFLYDPELEPEEIDFYRCRMKGSRFVFRSMGGKKNEGQGAGGSIP